MNIHKVALAIPFAFISLSLFAQSYTGKIYRVQTTQKGISKEIPFPEVVVTDGKAIATTREDGSFVLETSSKPSYIAITTPDGYSTSKFYQEVSGDANTLQFVLNKVARKKSETAKFVILNEPFLSSDRGWVDGLKRYAFYYGASFVVCTGRYSAEGRSFLEKELGIPVYFAISDASSDKNGPCRYSFIQDGVHFVVFSTASDGGKRSVQWLKSMLTSVGRSYPTVLITASDEINHSREMLSVGGDTLSLNDFNIRAIVDGCSTRSISLFEYRGRLSTSTICTSPLTAGGVDHSPAGFRLVTVPPKGNITTEMILTNIPNVATIVSPNDTAWVEDNKIRFYANVSSSQSPVKRVRIGISKDTLEYRWSELNRATPWTWSGFYVMTPADTATQYSLRLEAVAESGEVVKSQKSIVVATRKDSLGRFKGIWGNLGGNAAHNASVDFQFSGRLSHQWTASPQGSTLFSSPMIADSVVVTTLTNDLAFRKSELAAFHVETGKSLWHFFPRGAIKNTFTLDDGNVFATDVLGNVYAIDVLTGIPTWETTLEDRSKGFYFTGGVISDSLYITGNTTSVAALSLSDGSVEWELQSDSLTNGCESTFTVGNGILLIQNGRGGLVGYSIRDGKAVWSTPNAVLSAVSLSSTFSEGCFHVVSGDKYFAISAGDGSILKKVDLPVAMSTKSVPLVYENLLIYSSISSGMVAFNLQTNQKSWSVDVGSALVNTHPNAHKNLHAVESSPVRIGDYVVFGASDGYLYVASIANGDIKQKINLGAPIFSTVAAVGGFLFVTDLSGNMSAFRLLK